MKLFKAFGLAAFTTVAAFGLASCNNASNPSASTSVPANPSQSAVPSASKSSEGSASASSEKQIPIDDNLVLSGNYTYNSYADALGDKWNPHTWETNADNTILSYLSLGLVDMSIKDSENQEYQWVYEMATSITDVTKTHKSDLTKYKSTLPQGKTLDQVESGYVYEIKLNEKAKWANGEAINADSYVESMKRLLDPEMLNYRANTYIANDSAIAGAYEYYYSKTRGLYVGVGTKYSSNQAAVDAGETIYVDAHEFWGAKGFKDAEGNDCPKWLAITDTTVYSNGLEGDDHDECSGKDLWDGFLAPGAKYGALVEVGTDNASLVSIYQTNEAYDPSMGYSVVGLYKVDDYTINYVLKTADEIDYFLTSMTSNWLVYTPLYDQCTTKVGDLKTTSYGTSLETTMSYGPYKMTGFEDDKQIIFERDPQWYGYQKTDDGYLYSITNFAVDGKRVQQYITQKIVIDVLSQSAAKQKFLKGEVDEWAPEPSEVLEYNTSSQLYKVDETYTMRLFFNTNESKLQAMDTAGTNTNGIVMSNEKFRKAFSLCIDRQDFVTATEGYKPATYLMNSLYYYNIFEDPTSSYRSSEQAMKGIVDFYGYEYGADKQYKTLEEAYNAVTGYNLVQAQALMKEACDELVAAGKYTAGQPIKISLAWKKAPMEASDNALVAKLQKYLNAAIEGSGFGTITLEGLGGLTDRYKDVENGTYCIGYGAWGGAAFYPFSQFQVYMDPDHTELHEGGCWDPKTETLTLTVNGEEVTMTWQAWSNSMIGTGKYADADFDTKLYITSQLETKFMAKYYCVPLCTSVVVSLLSYKLNYYTEDYNIMYGFGGLRLMTYNYNDAEWTAYVANQGGELNYK